MNCAIMIPINKAMTGLARGVRQNTTPEMNSIFCVFVLTLVISRVFSICSFKVSIFVFVPQRSTVKRMLFHSKKQLSITCGYQCAVERVGIIRTDTGYNYIFRRDSCLIRLISPCETHKQFSERRRLPMELNKVERPLDSKIFNVNYFQGVGF